MGLLIVYDFKFNWSNFTAYSALIFKETVYALSKPSHY